MAQQRPAADAANNKRKAFRQSLELPIAVAVRGLAAPIYATLLDLSEGGCRFRSLILIERGSPVEFAIPRRDGSKLTLGGKIVVRAMKSHGAQYEYGVTFARLLPSTREEISHVLLEMQRRAGISRAEARTAPVAPSANAKQRRQTVRAFITFPIRFRRQGKPSQQGEASDIGSGGLRLTCPDSLPLGTTLELRFLLPSRVLDIYPPPTEKIEITPFGLKTVRIADHRKPFEEMTIHGRVVSQFDPKRTLHVHGVEFIDLDGYSREEIARFTHAVQLTKLRSA